MEEYRFDGYWFDGVTSMIYYNHGLERISLPMMITSTEVRMKMH